MMHRNSKPFVPTSETIETLLDIPMLITTSEVVLIYRKLSLSIIDNFAIFGVIELSVFVVKIINNSLKSNISIFEQNTGISTKIKYFFEKFNI
jgi:hypothetical protein